MSSDFQNFQLPAIQDCQDYVRLVPANSVVEIPVVGEFVYCKFSDGETKVRISGKTTAMESGDERRSGTVFNGVQLENDTDVDKAVVMVIGFGGFDRKIIQGEIVTVPGVRRADGTFVKDSRFNLDIFIQPSLSDLSGVVESGAVLATSLEGPRNGYGQLNGDILEWYGTQAEGGFDKFVYQFDLDLNYLGFIDPFPIQNNSVGQAIPKPSGSGYFAELNGDLTAYNDTTGQFETFAEGNSDVIHWASYSGGFMAVQGSGAEPFKGYIRIYNTEGEFQRIVDLQEQFNDPEIRISSNANLFIDESNNKVVLNFGEVNTGDSAETIIFDIDITEIIFQNQGYISTLLSNLGWSSNTQQSLGVYGDSAFLFDPFNDRVAKGQFFKFVYAFTGLAFQSGCENELIDVDELARRVSANVDSVVKNGRVIVTGEIIKTALELYFNTTIGKDYMDHVFSVEIYNTGGRRVSYSAGGAGDSLKALGVVDDLSSAFPGRIKLSIDGKMPLKG